MFPNHSGGLTQIGSETGALGNIQEDAVINFHNTNDNVGNYGGRNADGTPITCAQFK